MEPPYRSSSNSGRGDSSSRGYGGNSYGNGNNNRHGNGHGTGNENRQNGNSHGPPPEKRRRRRRWEPVDDRVVEVQNLRVRLDRISRMISTRQIPVEELCPAREPSPPPRYDNRGKRVNTRLDRAREKLETERFKIVIRLREIDPNFRPPVGMKPPKVIEKLIIPKEKEGTVNFIGLILGPRGKTQKRLEKEYSCRVAIRGKGSVKDGRASRNAPSSGYGNNNMGNNDADKLHVLISAEGLDAHERIAQCKQKIMDIIKPRPDELNDHKQAQLRELAQLNGTLRDHDRDRFNFAPNGGTPNALPNANAPTSQELEGDFQSLIGAIDGNPNPTDNTSSALKSEPGTVPGAVPGVSGSITGDVYPWNLPGAIATRQQPPPNEVPVPHPGHISAIRAKAGFTNHRYHNNNNNRNEYQNYNPIHNNNHNANGNTGFNAAAAARLAQSFNSPANAQAAPSWMTARPAAHRNYPGPPPRTNPPPPGISPGAGAPPPPPPSSPPPPPPPPM